MNHDTSFLNTGLTTAAQKKEQEKSAKRRDVRKEQHYKLKPAGEVVSSELQKEIDELSNIDYLEVEKMLTEDHFRAEMMARKKTVERLRAVKSRLERMLAVPVEPKGGGSE